MVTTIRKVTGGDHPFYEFACLSTDTKPTSLVPENSLCREIDTGKRFYFSGSTWHEAPARGGSGEDGGLPDNFPAEGSANANKFLGFDANGDYTTKDAPSSGGAEKFVVTLTQENDTWTADKTVSEIVAADEADQVVVAKYPLEGMLIDIPLLFAGTFSDDGVEMSIAAFATIFKGEHNTLTSITINAQGADEDVWGVEVANIEIPSNAPLIVTLTVDESTGDLVANKTYKEVYDAFNDGQTVTFKSEFSGFTVAVNMLSCGFANNEYSVAFVFGGSIVEAEGAETDNVSFHMN